MENKYPSSYVLKGGWSSASVQLRKPNTRHRKQANRFEGTNTNLLLCYGKEKCCAEGSAIRLDIIIAHSLYPCIFSKQQHKILKEALEKYKESLYVK